jgi:hypothetical protein
MSDDVSVAVVIEHASGVLAERFGLAISVADGILNDVARAQNRDVTELAAAVVASCTSETTPLPRRLDVIYDEVEGAA